MKCACVLVSLPLVVALLAPAARGQCETVGNPTDFAAGGFVNGGRGVQFECHAGATIDQWAAKWWTSSPDTFRFVAWESTDSGATWTKLDQDDVAVAPAGYVLRCTTTGRNITLTAGRRYAFIVYSCGTGDYDSQLFGLTPATTSFGYFTSLSPPTHALRADAFHAGPCDPTALTTTTGIGGTSPFELMIETEFCLAGPSCAINAPLAMASVGGVVTIDVDFDHVMSLPLTATFEYSTDAGTTWNQCTPSGGVNPVTGITTPTTGFLFNWDSIADGVGTSMVQSTNIRITVDDGSATSSCSVAQLQVDNLVPPPTCTLALTSMPPVRGVGSFDLVATSPSSMVVDATFAFSTDAGLTFAQATPGPAHTNPLIGVPTATPTAFDWDSAADAVGLSGLVAGVMLRASVDDGVAMGSCSTPAFDVDNSSLCGAICGDCNEDGTGPTILDALTAAQIASGLAVPSPSQMACCDVNSTLAVDIVDALLIAQNSAGLGVVLVCP